MIDGVEVRDRFDRSYAARMAENHVIPVGRGMWVSLYDKEDMGQARLVGAGAGLDNPMIAQVPLEAEESDETSDEAEEIAEAAGMKAYDEAPLTTPEAKRRLALTLGVEASNIKITVVDA